MLRHIKILACVVIAFIFSSCEDIDADLNVKLDKVEALIDEMPDSAMMILKTIDGNAIKAESQNARYALLYTTVLKRNYIKETNDSLINIAVDYYRNNRDARQLCQSLILKSEININNKAYDKAMLACYEVETTLSEFENNESEKGLLYVQLAYLHAIYYDTPRSLEYFKKAYSHLEGTNNSRDRMLALFGMCVNYMNQESLATEAIAEIEKGLKEAEALGNEKYILSFKCILFCAYYNVERYQEAIKLFEDIRNVKLSGNMYLPVYSRYSIICAKNGEMENCGKYMNLLPKYTRTKSDSIILYDTQAKIAMLNGENEKAIDMLLHKSILQKDNNKFRLEKPLMESQRDYLKSRYENIKKIQELEKQRMVIIVTIIIIVASMVILLLRRKNKNKQRKIDEYIGIIAELQFEMQKSNSVTTELINSLHKDKYKFLNVISDSILTHTNDAKGQRLVYNEMNRLIYQFSKDKNAIQELENTVNRCCNNVMAKLREELPTLDEIDYLQLCYHYAGFSGKLISLLLNKSQANIYMRKSRLKEKISQSNIKNKEEILAFLL